MSFPVPGNVLINNDENDADTNLETDASDADVGVDGDGDTTHLKIWISFSDDESK